MDDTVFTFPGAHDLESSARAASVAVSEAWSASERDVYCDAASADGHGGADAAAACARRASWLAATGRREQARAELAVGWRHHAEADKAVAWLRAHAAR